jgi:hypothetical protein
MKDMLHAQDSADASVIRGAGVNESAHAEGRYFAQCFDKDGNLKWEDFIENTVMTEGKNVMLDAALAGSSYTVVGPYMGLISSVSYSAIVAGDTAAQINGTNGWKEAGSSTNFPLYTTPRKTCAWSAASAGAKALSAALSFPIITTGGTIKGAFIIFGTGATSVIAATTGVLYSAGLFSGGDKVVAPSDVVSVSYSTSL